MILVVHGGPGQGSDAYKTSVDIQNIWEKKYGVAYWDQRLVFAAQGNSEGDITLKTYGDDLKNVVLTLKARYGQDLKVFILGHSFGGLVSTQFMTDGNNQNLVQGWIFADAVYDSKQNDQDCIDYATLKANEEIAKGNNVAKWQKIKTDVKTYDLLGTYDAAKFATFQGYLVDAMKIYLEADGESTELPTAISPFFLIFGFFTNADFGAYFANKADYVDRLWVDAQKQKLGVKLPSITKPVLVVTGKRDFIVSPIHAKKFFNLLPTGKKEYFELPKSYHFFEETTLFLNTVVGFVEKYK
jgi:pimeloyl-ACP methyl ester carboxylesterase